MKIEIRSDSVHIDGYVNAVGRDSRPIKSPKGDFVEMVEPGTFRAALDRAENVELQLNHGAKVLGSIKDGNLTLAEDSIGLRAQADITDAEVIEKARQGKLRGWSFGMTVNKCDYEERAEALPRRHLTDIDIFEVSLIDERMSPCYAGTSVECRAEGDILSETRANEEELEIIDTRAEDIDYSEWEQRIASLKVAEWEMRAAELRFNPYHDPTNGRFTDSTGGGMGGVLYSKGGKSAYVFDSSNISKKERTLDKRLIEQANATGSNFYEAGSAVERKYNSSLKTIDSLNISDSEKNAAKEKVFEYANNELKERTKYIDTYTAGPARSTNTGKHLEKATQISGEHDNYISSLKRQSDMNTHAENRKRFTSALSEATNAGAVEMSYEGKNYFRTNKKSNTWREGTLKDYKAEQAFYKEQKKLPIYQQKSWSSISADEKAKYYRATDNVSEWEERLAAIKQAGYE